ncbi:MAG TPA: histidine kinase dimerization/phospho-acceptor domain-containing protein, partial [Desulfobacteraceae bacterium]|nr:histidine kinase dimerization/phospho-acceptor domain-containing protein [Desulfobacteraceae bacterium]
MTLKNKLSSFVSPFMMAGILLILLPIFGIITLDRMEKQKAHIEGRFMARGLSLISTFEAGTRTGMLTMRWGFERIQTMLLETSYQPGIAYIIITSKNGKILAHSDASRVGTFLEAMPDTKALAEDVARVEHRTRQHQDTEVFEVFKRFTPLRGRGHGPHAPRHAMGRRGNPPPWHTPRGEEPAEPPPLPKCPAAIDGNCPERQFAKDEEFYIFAGLSMTQANRAKKRLIRNTIGRGIFFFIIGCAGMITLSAFQAYRSAKANLTSVKAFSDNVIENMPAGLITIDNDHRITAMNRAAGKILKEEVNAIVPHMAKLAGEMKKQDQPLSREITLNRGDAGELRLDMTASPVLDNDSRVLGFLFLFRDLTQLKRLQREIETTRHLAAIGKLAAGVAHEIRNPLSSIKGFATYLMKQQKEGHRDRKTAEIMVQEVERINRSITQLLEFAKPVAVETKPVNIKEIIRHSLALVQQDLDQKAVKAVVRLHTEKEVFPTDPDRISQILLNLYINAVHAMEASGELLVEVFDGNRKTDLEIRVTDNGCGIDSNHLEDVFDPYF